MRPIFIMFLFAGIRDLTGPEAFVNLDSFCLTLNSFAGIDLSANTRLRYLKCTSCDLNSLDVSRNPVLEEINCGRNRIEDLDVSQRLSLPRLSCNNNLLTSLDISRNTSLKLVGFDNMPLLTEVSVWTLLFPPSGVETLQEFSPNVSFTTECSVTPYSRIFYSR